MAVSQEVRNYLYRLHQVVAAATTTADACWAAAAGVVELCGGQAGVWLGEGPEGALTAGYAVHDGQSQRLAPPADGRVA